MPSDGNKPLPKGWYIFTIVCFALAVIVAVLGKINEVS